MLRVVPATVLGVAALLALAGCGAHDSTGQVSVTVSSNAADRPYEVKVFASTGKLSEHQRVFPGGTADFAGVPLGQVTVREQERHGEQERRGHVAGRGQHGHHDADDHLERLHADEQASPVDELADHPGGDPDEQYRQARCGLHEGDDDGCGVFVDEQPLRPDGLHPAADVAHQHRDPQGAEDRDRERRQGAAAGCVGGAVRGHVASWGGTGTVWRRGARRAHTAPPGRGRVTRAPWRPGRTVRAPSRPARQLRAG
ncbi:hypothetical protein NYS48_02915 [Curtobacterium flaccumfaciens pv. flaccumfaciens]|nr:hypothetical protein [Curtobacterium flaccumfaciens]MCS6564262.1 hypothetical protein [Curtobacterium flaccumfaciens pv. flaccumfaciens]